MSVDSRTLIIDTDVFTTGNLLNIPVMILQ